MRLTDLLAAASCCLLLSTSTFAQEGDSPAEEDTLWGHSSHGSAYDVGPRQKPWLMENIGHTPFPITSSHPEVQQWFDQGIALLHSFWYFEAERSFRWCLKLDPECAMAYWGMHLATKKDFTNKERSQEFLEQALERLEGITPRERQYIEFSEAFSAANEADKDERDEAMGEAMVLMDRLIMDNPDDLEAKALYWLNAGRALGERGEYARFGMESVLDSILVKDPDHVGALHYRVHNWDGKEGRYAVDTCMKLGEIGSGSGHLLHMPGHVLSSIGLWHEAAIAMDRATRVEKAYMHERMIVPEDNWDYTHNLHYLGFIQEQLGMVEQALIGAEQLVAGPGWVEAKFAVMMQRNAWSRAMIKFERWDALLDEDQYLWDKSDESLAIFDAYGEMRAHLGVGDAERAEELFDEWTERLAKSKPKPPGPDSEPDPNAFMTMRANAVLKRQLKEIDARLQLARGDLLEGMAALTAAAEEQVEEWDNDPPMESTFLYNSLGEEYLKLGAPRLAVECFERTLETVFHDGFALAGLVVANHELGEREAAQDAMAKLQVIWSDADRPNRWLEAAEATGVSAEPFLEAPIEQRNYKREILDVHGPSLWDPTDAPNLTAVDAEGNDVSLDDYSGKNVLAIFYLGEECVHCIEQINLAEERLEEIEELNTVVLGISKDEVEEIFEQQESLGVKLLSDPDFVSAKRFHSFDDFEEIELHSTFIIDASGRVQWSRIGGDPFTDFDFIVAELERLDRRQSASFASSKSENSEPASGSSTGSASGSLR